MANVCKIWLFLVQNMLKYAYQLGGDVAGGLRYKQLKNGVGNVLCTVSAVLVRSVPMSGIWVQGGSFKNRELQGNETDFTLSLIQIEPCQTNESILWIYTTCTIEIIKVSMYTNNPPALSIDHPMQCKEIWQHLDVPHSPWECRWLSDMGHHRSAD